LEQPCQLQRSGQITYQVEGHQWEKRRIGRAFIDLEVDSSTGLSQYFKARGHWLPRNMAIGDVYERRLTLDWYWKEDCRPVSQAPPWQAQGTVKLVARHEKFVTHGVAVPDVIELNWSIDGEVEQTVWYAAGLGVVRRLWRDGRESWIAALFQPGSRPDLEREEIPCIDDEDPDETPPDTFLPIIHA